MGLRAFGRPDLGRQGYGFRADVAARLGLSSCRRQCRSVAVRGLVDAAPETGAARSRQHRSKGASAVVTRRSRDAAELARRTGVDLRGTTRGETVGGTAQD